MPSFAGVGLCPTPTNLTELNSVYDDFNSDLPFLYHRTDIYFSSNRNSQGNDFDVTAGGLDFSYHSRDDILNLSIVNEVFRQQAGLLFNKVNTENNELGPFSLRIDEDMLFMYATDSGDSFSIKLVEYTNWENMMESVISDPLDLEGINGAANNLYPSIDETNNTLLFCSDREDEVYNIYTAHYRNAISKQTLTEGDIESIEKETILSSPYDDKCPYVKDDLIVFASNREGGYGGYDLYYSHYMNGTWSEPEIFGENINSEYDDYRPIICPMFEFTLMIFSSNRPEGKGGFDLYIVNIDEL